MAVNVTANASMPEETKKPARARRRTRKSKKRVQAESPSTDASAAPLATETADQQITQVDVADVGVAAESTDDGSSQAPQRKRPRVRKRRAAKKATGSDGRSSAGSRVKPEEPPVAASVEPAETPEKPKPATSRKKGRRTKRGRSSPKETAPTAGGPVSVDASSASGETPAEERRSPATSKTGKTEKQTAPAKKGKHRPARRRPIGGKKPKVSSPEEELDGPDEVGTGKREMVINVSEGEECRIAVLHEGRLEELFIERSASQSHVGNIYKGRVTNVEPSIQAAFVDFGMQKNGFLHISDVQPQYFPNHSGEPEDVGRKIPRHHRPPIQKCFRRGQEVMVQITKEGVGTKGPTLTTYLSIPGRYIVMMPGMSRHGVSRKIEDEAARRTMRDVLAELTLPPGMGFIIRTAGLNHNKRELQRDLNYLNRLWKTVVERVKRLNAPAELYEESDLVTRTIRDVYTTDFRRIVVDDEATLKRAQDFLQIAMPRTKIDVQHYTGTDPLFHHFGIEEEINRIHSRHVPLASGGSLVIDSTEALVAIDVNSGKFRSVDDAEESAFRIDVEAATEIARQLRLRDLGGLIVCDFIDLRLDRNKRAVEKALRDALKKHKERARILRMSSFGLIEMTRQRQGPSVKRNIYSDCPHCGGGGLVKLPESVILDVMRFLQLAAHRTHVAKISVRLASDVAFQLLNTKRTALNQLEVDCGKPINIQGDAGFTSDQVEFACEDSRGRPVNIDAPV